MKKVFLILSLFFSTTSVWCLTYYSKSGATDFTSTASWGDVADGSGNAPASISTSDAFIIANGAVMNLDAGNADVRSLTINAGSLTISSNTLTVSIGASNNNTFLGVASGGSLTITGGNLILNGNAFFADNSSLTQSGGLFSIDPNSGAAGTSVGNAPSFGLGYAAAGAASTIQAANVNKFSLTGGVLRIVDPPLNASASALAASILTGNFINFGASHTLELGDGSSTTAGGNTAGFNISGAVSTGRLSYGNLTLSTVTNASNRHVSLATSSGFTGNVTINLGSELRGSTRLSVAKNVTNDGILVIPTTTYLALETYTSGASTATANAQTVSGSGTFKNAATGETANATRLLINNTNLAGVTFSNNITEFTVNDIINLTAGLVTMGDGTKTLTCGISTAVLGTFTHTVGTGRINGKFKKWVGTTATSYGLPVGTSTTLRTATVNFTGAPTGAGALTAQFKPTSPGLRNLPQTFDIAVETVSPTGYWTIESTVTGGTYTATFNASNFTKSDGVTVLTATANTRLLKGATSGSSYTVASTGNPTAFSTINITGQTTFSDFALGGTNSVLSIEFQSITAFSKGKSNSINWVTASEQDVQAFGIERSVDNQTWVQIGTTKATGGSSTTAYTFTDEAPLALNYYRIRSIENSGKDQFSKIVSVKRSNEKLSLAAVYPMPITEGVTLDVVSHKAGKVLVSITDIVGRVVKTDYFMVEEGSNTRPLNLTQLAKGTYILNLTNGEVHINQRIVKQ